ncbi:MAG TPA: hypothetical protein VK674_06870 [Candidatus Limnocylindria bacterium]|nr:hypothetical protein [Candidatus Limnocylindria bacterium]
MHIPKRYFHDRLVVLLLSINTFLALLGGILVLFRLDAGGSDVYIVQYRANLGLSAFKRGGSAPLLSFAVFGLLVLAVHVILSMRVYPVRRQFAITILAMASLLLCLSIIVSNALLILR